MTMQNKMQLRTAGQQEELRQKAEDTFMTSYYIFYKTTQLTKKRIISRIFIPSFASLISP